MARNFILKAVVFSAFLSLQCIVNAQETAPADKSQLNTWFNKVVTPISARKGTLDSALEKAEAAPPKIINVRAGGGGDFKTLTEAIKSIPEGNQNRIVIKLGPGNYTEKVTIPANKPFVTLYGDPNAMPVIVFHGTAKEYGTVDSASLIVESDYFVGANLKLANSAPRPTGQLHGGQAEALRISGDKSVFYNCKFYGFQDTVCDDKGLHLFKDCYIEGTVDFIFGNGRSIYLNTEIHVIAGENQGWITAQARHNGQEDTAYSFIHCTITGTGSSSYLGRSWMPYAKVIFSFTDMSDAVHPEGWSDNKHPETQKTVFFGEFNSKGAGTHPDKRPGWVKKLSPADANPFLTLGFIQASKWLLPPPRF